jgi:uncharacterized protein YndB with AHSA1/START domain
MDAITAERSIVVAADRERVWRAISRPEAFTRWFKEPQMEFERLEVGQVISFRSGDQIHPPGKIAIVEPPERFGFYWQAAPNNPAMTLVTFRLETVPEGTRITVTEQGFEQLPGDLPETLSKRNAQGWGIALDRLAEYLRGPEHG